MAKKDKLIKIVAGTLATTIFFESCVKDNIFYNPSSVTDINSNSNNLEITSEYNHLIIQLSDEEREYIDFINYLLIDIMENEGSASKFLSNPNKYAKNAGFMSINVNLEDDMIKLILNLADKELKEAVKANDMKTFLKLCNEKGIIEKFDINNSSVYKKIIEKNPEINNFIKNFSFDEKGYLKSTPIGGGNDVSVEVGIFGPVLIAAVAVAAVVALVGAVVESVAIWTTKWVTNGLDVVMMKGDQSSLLQLWDFNGGKTSDYILMLSEFEEQQIDIIISSLREQYPDKFIGVDDEALKQFIRLNIQKFDNK